MTKKAAANAQAFRMAERIEVWAVRDLKPYERNPRTHSEGQVRKLAASMTEFGWTNPVLIGAGGEVIAGHGRLEAAKLLGIEEAPCVVLDHLSDTQRRAYLLADNRLALDSDWDLALLADELAALEADGYDVGLTGFADAELAEIAGAVDAFEGDDNRAEEIPDPPADPITQPGDLWRLGRHRLRCGSALVEADFRAVLDGARADCIWTDPPYNVDYHGAAGAIENDALPAEDFAAFIGQALKLCRLAVRDGGPVYVAHADTGGFTFRRAFLEAGFVLASCLVWRKHALVLGRGDYHWQHEPILYGWAPGRAHPWFGARDKTTLLEFEGAPFRQVDDRTWQIHAGGETLLVEGDNLTVRCAQTTVIPIARPMRSAEHPTMKPVALVERMLRNSAKAGAVVLDPFGGSGSTLIAAERLGMSARLIELDPRYCDVIIRRWEQFTGRQAERLAGGGRSKASAA